MAFRPPNANAAKIWDYLILEMEATKKGAAAVLGNFHWESGLRPEAIEGNGEGHGLAQWSFGRKSNLLSFAQRKGKSWKNLDLQLEFMKNELRGSYQSSLRVIRSADKVGDAAYKFHRLYEGSADTEAMIRNNRMATAYDYYRYFRDRTPSGTPNVEGRAKRMSKKAPKKNPYAAEKTPKETTTDDADELAIDAEDAAAATEPDASIIQTYAAFSRWRIPIIEEIILMTMPGNVQIDVTQDAYNADAPLDKDYPIRHGDNAWDLILDLAKSITCTVYTTAWGTFRIDTEKKLIGTQPVATVNEGPDGVMVSMNVQVSRDDAYNGVYVTGESTEVNGTSVPGGQAYRVIDTPDHPMEWGGPFGKRMLILDNIPLITNGALAAAHAEQQLQQYAAASRTLDFTAIPNPLLEPEDVILMTMLDGTIEHHLLTKISIPLGYSGSWSANTLSTRVKNTSRTHLGGP